MDLAIIVPVAVIVVISSTVLVWARQTLKDGPKTFDSDDPVTSSSHRLTSDALRTLPSPPWRIVHEIAPAKLGGIGHVLIGPPGIYAVQTRMDPLPAVDEPDTDAHAVAEAAISRGALDDALGTRALSSDRLLVVHWGVNAGDAVATEPVVGVTAVDGRRLAQWAATLDSQRLSAAQVDLAWQAVVTSIGRPDPLA